MGDSSLEGQPYRSAGGKMVYNEILKREIPDCWGNGNILDVANLGGGGTPNTKNPDYWGGTIPFFTPTDAEPVPYKISTEEWITVEGFTNSSTKVYPAGTVFITARGSVGKVMITAVEMAMNQSCYALSPKSNGDATFLYFHTLSLIEYLRVKSSGSIFKSIVTNDFNFTPAVVPAEEVISSFNEIAAPFFERILINQRQSARLSEVRDWLLPMLMNGQVKIS